MAEIIPTLCIGAGLVLMSEATAQCDPRELLRFINRHQITVMFLTTQLCEMFLVHEEQEYNKSQENKNTIRKNTFDGRYDLSLRLVFTGGEVLHRGPRDNCCFVLVNIYGPTENTVCSSFCIVSQQNTIQCNLKPFIGRPVSGTCCVVLDEQKRLCPVGVYGELYVGGEQLSKGYFKNPKLTEDKFIPNPFQNKTKQNIIQTTPTLYRTGDICRWRHIPTIYNTEKYNREKYNTEKYNTEKDNTEKYNTMLEYSHRADLQVKIRGHRVELSGIESVLINGFEGVSEACCVVFTLGQHQNQVLCLFYTGSFDGEKELLKSFLSNALPEYMVPTFYVKLNSMPLNANHKIDRTKLPKPPELRQHSHTIQERTSHYSSTKYNNTQDNIKRIFSEVLGLDLYELKVDFFSIGGNSLAATRVLGLISSAFGVVLMLSEFIECGASVVGVAGLVDRKLAKPKIKKSIINARVKVEYSSSLRKQRISNSIRFSSLRERTALSIKTDTKQSVLTYNQRSLWFLHQVDPQNVEYVVHSTVLLPAPSTNNIRFHISQCVNTITSQHASLRTTYSTHNGIPFPVIQPVMQQKIIQYNTVEFLSKGQLIEAVESEVHRPWDLSKQVFRVMVYQSTSVTELTNAYCIVLFTAHHIAMDGYSLELLLYKFHQLYNNNDIPVSEELTTMTQHAEQQSKRLTGAEGRRLWTYWQRQLANYEGVLHLPTDFTRPTAKHSRLNGDIVSFIVDVRKAQTHTSIQGVTTFMLLLASYFVLLYRYTGKGDIVIGTPMSCRGDVKLKNTIGNITNLIPLRIQISKADTFNTILLKTRDVVIAAYDHQSFPFSLLVERLASYRDPVTPPLVQAILSVNQPFVAQHSTTQHAQLKGVCQRVSPFDLQWVVDDEGIGELNCKIQYRNDLFSQNTIHNMAKHLVNILEQFSTAENNTIVSTFNYLTSKELDKILVDYSGRRQHTITTKQHCIHQLFENMVEHSPYSTATSMDGVSWTYDELNTRSNILAHYLRVVAKVRPNTRVGILMRRSPEMVLAMLGVCKAGCVYVPLDVDFPQKRIDYVVQDSRMQLVLVNTIQKNTIRKNTIQQNTIRKDVAPEEDSGLLYLSLSPSGWCSIVSSIRRHIGDACLLNPDPPQSNDWGDTSKQWQGSRSLCYLMYTSGSTGHPKGVEVEHRSLVNLVQWHKIQYSMTSRDRASQIVGAAFDPVGLEVWPALASGGSVVFANDDVKSDVTVLCNWLKQKRITVCLLPTPLAELFLKQKKHSFPQTLRVMYTGGDKLHIPVDLQTHFRLDNHYGPAEATIMCTYYTIPTTNDSNELILDPKENTKGEKKSFCPWIGRPLANCEVYVLDDCRQPVPCIVPGELYIGGLGVARGYNQRPDLTASCFISSSSLPFLHPSPQAPHHTNPETNVLYRTGDVVRMRHDGNLEFIGRIDSQVKVRGVRVELSEIESMLKNHESVVEACVLAREDAPGRMKLCAYVVLLSKHTEQDKESNRIQNHELMSWLKDRLPEVMIPSAFVFLDKLPYTVNGKVDKRALPPPSEEHSTTRSANTLCLPRSKTEATILSLFAQTLSLTSLSIYDSFFDLGGNSLLLTQLLFSIKETFNVSVSINRFFRKPTVEGVAALILGGQHTVDSDVSADCSLGDELEALIGATHGGVHADKTDEDKDPLEVVFVTGVTGFLGCFVLKHFLCDSPSTKQIHCLIRAQTQATALQRLKATLETYDLLHQCQNSNVQLVTYTGDLDKHMLGLDQNEFDSLGESVGTVFHCGAFVNSVYPYKKLHKTNVFGTKEVLRLVSKKRNTILIHVSTLSVFGRKKGKENVVFGEEEIGLEAFTELEGGYAQSKLVAEQLVNKAISKGVNAIIFRPGRITGDSTTGVSNYNDFMSTFIKGCIQLKCAPNLNWPMDSNPVDVVVKTMAAIAVQKSEGGGEKYFNMFCKQALGLVEVIEKCGDLGYTCPIIPYKSWRQLLLTEVRRQTSGVDDTTEASTDLQEYNALTALIHIFDENQEMMEKESGFIFSMKNTDRIMKQNDIVVKTGQLELWELYFEYMIKQDFLPPPMVDTELDLFALETG